METVVDPTRHKTEVAAATGGVALEAVGGLATMALGILALVGVLPVLLTEIGGIVFGASMLVAGIAIAGAWSRLTHAAAQTRNETVQAGGGAGVEMVVGVAGIALGVLSLLGVTPHILMPALIIAGGIGLLLSAGTPQQLNDLRMINAGTSYETRRIVHESVRSSAVAQALGGLAAVVLGILGLVLATGLPFGTLTEIGIIVLGLSVAISGGALTGKLGSMTHAA